MKKALIPILLFVLGTGYVFFFAPENSTPQERETAQLGGLLEDTARRTLFSQTFTDGTNTIRQFHQAPIFYETLTGLEPLAFEFTDTGTAFESLRNGTKVTVKKTMTDQDLISIQNDWENAGQQITFTPQDLLFVDLTDRTNTQAFRSPEAVTGVMLNPQTIRFPNAWGHGIHLEVTVMRTKVKKDIVIDSRDDITLPVGLRWQFLASFKVGGNITEIRDSADRVFDGSIFEADDGFSLDGKARILPTLAKDSSLMGNFTRIPIFWRRINGELFQMKVIPRAYINNATYPIRADATYAPLTGATTDDGSTLTRNGTRSTARSTNTTTYGQENDTAYWGMVCENDAGQYQYGQAYFQFDTSAIPDTDVISSGSLQVYTNEGAGLVTDAYTQRLVGHTITDNGTNYTNLANNNASISATAYTTMYSDDDIDADTVLTQRTWNLNTAGKSYVSKTGNTLFALRLSGDMTDAVPTGRNLHWVAFEESATDPVLTLTSGPAPSAKGGLRGNVNIKGSANLYWLGN
jgi:hypothetical protein